MKFLIVILIALVAISAGSRASGTKSPTGRTLPSVAGRALDGTQVRFPEGLAGNSAVLLVAYRRGTQPDVDRWMAFLKAKHPEVVFYEVPTIGGAVWQALQGWIDSGMRGGVPKESWSRVVTLYEDAETLKAFLGDAGGLRTHVVLLDARGTVVWFYAGGYTEEAASILGVSLGRVGSGSAREPR
jgi:hypothetical protein